MNAAYVVEAHGRQTGLIVTVVEGRFRYFSAISETAHLDGSGFRTPAEARRAAERAVSAAAARKRAD